MNGLRVLLAAVALSACGSEPAPEPTSTPSSRAVQGDPASALRSLVADEQLRRAFAVAYPGPAPVRRPADDGEITIRPGRLIWAPFGPVLLTERTNADDCHACSGGLGVDYLTASSNGFVAGRDFPEAIPGSGFGEPPSGWRVEDGIGPAPVIWSTGGSTNQGYTCEVAFLTELMPGGPRQIARIPVGYSDEGAVGKAGGTSLAGTLRNVVPGRSFDIAYTGSRSFTDRYVRDGDLYHVEGQAEMTEC